MGKVFAVTLAIFIIVLQSICILQLDSRLHTIEESLKEEGK